MKRINRRQLLQNSVAIAGSAVLAGSAKADVMAGRDPFEYEVTRTEDEWLSMLGDDFAILRTGKTEKPKSSPLWEETREGTYHCKGCDLPQYTSRTKVVLDKGWLFFTASEPNAQLMSQDSRAEMADQNDPFGIYIEVHCRRCGSHIGHILPVVGRALHCINGAALSFEEI